MKVQQLGTFIRKQRQGAQISLHKLSQAAGVSKPYLSQIERGLRKPSAEILQAIAKGLRISAQTLYVQAGILEQDGKTDVHASLTADRNLTERQKKVLLQVYESFREETAARRAQRRSVVTAEKLQAETAPAPKRPAGATSDVPSRPRSKTGGRAETQADPSPHPAPLRSSAPNVRTVR
jgi:transcriptional regulator with XRE-family HTH domain